MTEVTRIRHWTTAQQSENQRLKAIPDKTQVFEIDGPMFFATSEVLSKIEIKEETKTVIIRMRNIPSLDITALRELKKIYTYLKEKGVKVLFSHANPQPLSVMKKAGFYDEVGEKYFVENIDVALDAAQKMSIE